MSEKKMILFFLGAVALDIFVSGIPSREHIAAIVCIVALMLWWR